MLAAVRADVASRLNEVRQLLDLIRQLEVAPPAEDPPEARILRGLFFVHLYAALEFTVTQGVQRLLVEADRLRVPAAHLEPRFHAVVLDPLFSSLRNIGEEKRWQARVKVIDAQAAPSAYDISSDLFGLFLQNVKVDRLETLFNCLNVPDPIVPDPSYRLYVDELVDFRNGVAHGRFSALGVGRRMRSAELLARLTAMNAVCGHILDCLDRQHATRGYIRADQRSVYQQDCLNSESV